MRKILEQSFNRYDSKRLKIICKVSREIVPRGMGVGYLAQGNRNRNRKPTLWSQFISHCARLEGNYLQTISARLSLISPVPKQGPGAPRLELLNTMGPGYPQRNRICLETALLCDTQNERYENVKTALQIS